MSFLANRNVQIFNSTMSVSTLNTSAMAISTLTGSTLNASTINVSTLSGSTLTASTMTGNQITISTLTVSSINNGTPGVAAYSTFNASSINTSSITMSSITVAPGYNSNISNILYTSLADSGQTAANFVTTGMPGTAPAGSVISASYRLTAGASSGAALMRLSTFTYVAGTTYNFTFTGMQGSQTLALYVNQYNAAGTASIQISANVYNITTSAATVSGSFIANLYPSTYTGTIVFYFQAAAVNQYVNFTAFSMTTGTMNVGIGTTNPNALLCVGPNGGVNQSGFLPGISMTSVSGQNMYYSVGQGTAGTNNIHMGWVYNATAASGYGHVSCYGGNNSLILQSGSGNVGIGTVGPSYALDVAGYARATSGLLAGNGTGAVSLQLFDLPAAAWQISTGGYNLSINNNSASWTNRLTITQTGNVGIGVAAPSTKLHIYDNPTNVIRMQTSGSDSAYIVATYDYVFLSANYTSAGVRDNTGRGSAQIVLSQPTAGGIITFNTSPSVNTDVQERMRITSAGNVGMGTASPSYKLHVYGSMCLDRGAAAYSSTLAATTYAAGTWYTIFAPYSLTVSGGTYLISMFWAPNPGNIPWNLGTSFLFYNVVCNDNSTSQLSGATVPTSYHATNNAGDWQLSVRAQAAGGSYCGLQWKSNGALPNGNWTVWAHLISV